MSPDDKNSAVGNFPALEKHVDEDQDTTSANAQDQTLLKALQDLVMRVMDPMQKNDGDKIHLRPEAGKLITALQEFISSIVARSRSGTQNTVEVSLDEEDDLSDNGEDDKSSSKEAPLQTPSSSELHRLRNSIENANSGNLVVLEKPRLGFEEKVLRAFREHVFNKMPIRLLCFDPDAHGSRLQITLLERSALFSRLALVVRRRIHQNEFLEVGSTEGTIQYLLSQYAGYAILSHTWLRTAPGEVTYDHWNKGLFSSEDPGYRKLVNFCKAAWKDRGLSFGWMDTVCINKESSSELDESIRSMYNWYNRATVCITYLAETTTLEDMHFDPWFTRGWTLQELLAPVSIKFYNVHWKRLIRLDHANNDKRNAKIRNQIEKATTISEDELHNIRTASISRRMQLAATREVAREEDTAYSLMGIFDVSISTAYGEGAPRAFLRLLQAILVSSRFPLDILNWAGEFPSPWPYNSIVLPSGPQYYSIRSSIKSLEYLPPSEPLTLTHMGLRVPVVLMPGLSISETPSIHSSIGDYHAIVDYAHTTGFFEDGSSIPAAYDVLDSRTVFGNDGWTADHTRYQLTFAVVNFTRIPGSIFLPKTCIAILLKCSAFEGRLLNRGNHTRIQTSEPVVFELGAKNAKDTSDEKFWVVKYEELAKHGMQLVNWYL